MSLRKQIIDILQQDAKISNKTLAAMLGVSVAEIVAEIKALEETGVIRRYEAVVNTELLGDEAPAEALVELKVLPQRDFGYNDIARRVYKFPEVKALYLMSGRYDLAVKVEAPTMKAISQFVFEKLAVLEGITSTETLFIMRKYKEDGEIFVEEEKEDRLVVTP